MDVTNLLKAPEIVDALLEKLDKIARDQSAYEYGLPIHTDACKAQLREAVYRWISDHTS